MIICFFLLFAINMGSILAPSIKKLKNKLMKRCMTKAKAKPEIVKHKPKDESSLGFKYFKDSIVKAPPPPEAESVYELESYYEDEVLPDISDMQALVFEM